MATSIFQATTEEHLRLAAELHREYLGWVARELKAAFGIDVGQEVGAAQEQFMAQKDELGPPLGRLYLVEENGQLAGTGALKALGHEVGYVKRMYVRPAHRGQGLSRLILEKILVEARVVGYRHAYLETARFMTVAQNLYRSVGFREREAFAGSEIPPDFHYTAIFMELDL